MSSQVQLSVYFTQRNIQYWIIEDNTFYAINIAANMVISSQKFFKADRYRYVVPIFYRLLELARSVESESLHEDSKTEMKSTTTKGKGKVSVATVDSTSQQIQQLQGAVKGLTKMLQGNQQMTQTPQYVSQPTQNTIQELVQNDMNTPPQAPQAKTLLVLLILRELEVAEVAIEVEAEVEEVQYYAIGVETSYLRSKLVIKWLNVPIRNKPRIAGGKISLVMFKGKHLLHNLKIQKTDKGNYS